MRHPDKLIEQNRDSITTSPHSADLFNTDVYNDLLELRTALRRVRDMRGDDKCWKDWEGIYKLLPEGYTPPKRDETIELDLCRQYIASCHNPDVTYTSPQRRIEELEKILTKYKDLLGRVIGRAIPGMEFQFTVFGCDGWDIRGAVEHAMMHDLRFSIQEYLPSEIEVAPGEKVMGHRFRIVLLPE